MTDKPGKICPHCGQPVQTEKSSKVAGETPAANQPEAREYDHRGVLMPRRTRIGGVIVPQ